MDRILQEPNNLWQVESSAAAVVERLNILLSDYQIFYMNLRGFHWNIKGERFFELHAKFEELYLDALEKVDEIAERILTLGFKPVHTFTDYVNLSNIQEVKNICDPYTCASNIVDALRLLISEEREILPLTGQDEGTNSILTDYIRQQEKLVWMFSAYLSS